MHPTVRLTAQVKLKNEFWVLSVLVNPIIFLHEHSFPPAQPDQSFPIGLSTAFLHILKLEKGEKKTQADSGAIFKYEITQPLEVLGTNSTIRALPG